MISELPPGVEVRQVPTYPMYYAGNDGHIYSGHVWRGRTMRQLREVVNPRYPYLWVGVTSQPGVETKKPVHRLVADAWLGPLPAGMQRRHLDGNPQNNRPENIAFGTPKENMADRDRHGTTVFGDRQHSAHTSDEQVQWALDVIAAGEMSQRAVAEALGVAQSTVSAWVLGRKRTRRSDGSVWRSLRYRGSAA